MDDVFSITTPALCPYPPQFPFLEEEEDGLQNGQTAELWQVMTRTHTDKKHAEIDVRASSCVTKLADDVSKVYGDIDEAPVMTIHAFQGLKWLAEASRMGLSLKRLPKISYPDTPRSRFLIIDIDNDVYDMENKRKIEGAQPPNITREELRPLENDKFIVLPSTSNNVYKHHIFCELDYPMTSNQLYPKLVEILGMLSDKLGRKVTCDPRSAVWGQVIYGCCQDAVNDVIMAPYDVQTLQLTEYRSSITTRTPECRECEQVAQHIHRVPISMTELRRMLGEDIHIGPGFEFNLPWVTQNGRKKHKKIPIGERQRTLSCFMLHLYDMWRLANYHLSAYGSECYSEEDIVNTFKNVSTDSFVDDGDFDKDLENIVLTLRKRIRSNSAISDADWIAQQAKKGWTRQRKLSDGHKEQKEVWKRRGYNKTICQKIIDKYRVGDKVIFQSRAELNRILTENYVKSMTSFTNCCKNLKVSIECREKANVKKRNKKASQRTLQSKYQHILDTSSDGIYYYAHFSKAESRFCERRHIRYLSAKKRPS